jgi:hypothetical protein
MEFLDIRTLEAASLVNRDFKYGADRLIWQSFYICVHAHVRDVDTCNRELRRIEEGCHIACTGLRCQGIRKFTLTFSSYYTDDYPTGEFLQSIMKMVFRMLRRLTGLRQLELDLACASPHIDGIMSNLIRGPFPFQLERFALNKVTYAEMDFLPEFLLSQKSIRTLSINWRHIHVWRLKAPRRRRPLRVLDSGEWHLLKNRPITHLFASLIHPDEVFDLFGSLSQSTATLQLLWFRTSVLPPSCAFFRFAANPIATTVVSNLRYLVLEIVPGGDIRPLSLFTNLEELVIGLNTTLFMPDLETIENDFFESSKSCPRLRKAALSLYNQRSGLVIRFYRRMGAEEDWELTREDIDKRKVDERGALTRRRHRFPAMVRVS